MFSMLKTVLKMVVRTPATRRYPFTKRVPIGGARGHLVIDANLCVYCGICAKRCPANALGVVRDPKSWTLDPHKCIICGYCVEVCPKKCLAFDPGHIRASGTQA